MPRLSLVATNLRCDRGGRTVFEGVSFAVAAGGALALTGPNGAGKTSLLRLVAGLVPRAGGDLILEGGDGEYTIGEQTHYLGHHDAVKPTLTVAENLAFWSRALGGSAGLSRSVALDAVALGGLANLPAQVLSEGQRRRLALARLLAVRRPLWLLDEPLTALDADAQTRLVALIDAHLKGGGLALVATHAALAFATAELKLGGAA